MYLVKFCSSNSSQIFDFLFIMKLLKHIFGILFEYKTEIWQQHIHLHKNWFLTQINTLMKTWKYLS